MVAAATRVLQAVETSRQRITCLPARRSPDASGINDHVVAETAIATIMRDAIPHRRLIPPFSVQKVLQAYMIDSHWGAVSCIDVRRRPRINLRTCAPAAAHWSSRGAENG